MTYLGYEKLSHVVYINNSRFPSMQKLEIPKHLHDYRFHVADPSDQILLPYQLFRTLKSSNYQFTSQLGKFCKKNGIICNVPPTHFGGEYSNKLACGPLMCNLWAGKPYLVFTARELLEDGTLNGLASMKVSILQELGIDFGVISLSEWENSDYFDLIIAKG